MKLRNRSTWIAALLVTVVTLLGISSVQASSPYYYRQTPITPVTVTCTATPPSIHFPAHGAMLVEVNVPANGRVVTDIFVNGSLFNHFAFSGPDTESSVDNFGANPGAMASYPLSFEERDVVEVDGRAVYSSTFAFTCSGDGVFPVTLTNVDLLGGSNSAISDGRINPENFAPVALYCDGSVLQAYKIDGTGGTFAWSFDFKNAASAKLPLVNQGGMTLSTRDDGRYYVLAPQGDGKQYLFVFGGCPAPGATDVYISDPATGQFVPTD